MCESERVSIQRCAQTLLTVFLAVPHLHCSEVVLREDYQEMYGQRPKSWSEEEALVMMMTMQADGCIIHIPCFISAPFSVASPSTYYFEMARGNYWKYPKTNVPRETWSASISKKKNYGKGEERKIQTFSRPVSQYTLGKASGRKKCTRLHIRVCFFMIFGVSCFGTWLD